MVNPDELHGKACVTQNLPVQGFPYASFSWLSGNRYLLAKLAGKNVASKGL